MGLSEAFQRGGRGVVPAQRCWVGCGWRDYSSAHLGPCGTKRPGEEEVQRVSPRLWSCCPEPGSESRFRIRPEPWAAAWWGEILLPQFPGSLTLRPGLVAVVHSSSGSHCPRDTLAFQPRALAFQPWALTEVDPAPSGKSSKRWRPGSGGSPGSAYRRFNQCGR